MFHRAELRLPAKVRLGRLSTEQIREHIWSYKDDIDAFARYFEISIPHARRTVSRITGETYGMNLLKLYDHRKELMDFIKNLDYQIFDLPEVTISRHLCIAKQCFLDYMEKHQYPWHKWVAERNKNESLTSPNPPMEEEFSESALAITEGEIDNFYVESSFELFKLPPGTTSCRFFQLPPEITNFTFDDKELEEMAKPLIA